MKTDLIDKGDLCSQLTITVEPEDYKPKFDKQLRKHSKEAQLKGFRKGKVPISAVRKMYGMSVLSDVVNNLIDSTVQKVIADEELDILGHPIPAEDQDMIVLDPKVSIPYEFKFDFGLAPAFAIAGIAKEDAYDSYKIQIADSDIDDQLSDLQKRMGEQEEVEDAIQELDILTLSIVESSPEDEEPFAADITLMPDRMTDEYKEDFVGKSKGYKTQVDIFNLEKDASIDYVMKYFLKDAPDSVSSQFDVEVKTIKRLVPAEVNDEFFGKAFGEEVKDESAARTKLTEDLSEFYKSQGQSITRRYILEQLIEKNDLELPDAFLKRWLATSNDELTPEQIEEEYPDFTKNLKWTLIKKEVVKQFELTVSQEDIKSSMIEKFKAQFAQYGYGGMGDMDYDGIADRMMQNQESVQKEYEELLAEKVLDKVMEEVSLNDKEITSDEYKTIVEDLRQNNAG